MYVIVGLGNPGKEYAHTRHNIGFDAIDMLAEKRGVKLNKMKYKAVYGDYTIGDEKVYLFKPLTFMNASGEAIRPFVDYYKVPPENVIVIYDDIDLSVGALRVRECGSSGTHNGMKSVIYQLRTEKFPRIRVGIGKNSNEHLTLIDHVLGRFNDEDRIEIDDILDRAGKAAEAIVKGTVANSMNRYNKNVKKAKKIEKADANKEEIKTDEV